MKETKTTIFNGKSVVTVDASLIEEYESLADIYNAITAEYLLSLEGYSSDYTNEQLSEALSKILHEEIEFGKEVLPDMVNGNLIRELLESERND